MAKKQRVFARAPVRALGKEIGIEYMSPDAVSTVIDELEKQAKKRVECAIKLAKHAKRKTVTRADMEMCRGL